MSAAQPPRPFAVAADGVDPRRVPTRTLPTGAQIPAIGLGTFGSDRYTGEEIAQAVVGAAEVGYRHFDCASVYGNEDLIGPALQTIHHGRRRRPRGPLGHVQGLERPARASCSVV